MTGKKPILYWRICWTIVSPLMLISVLIAYVALEAQYPPTFGTWNPAYELFPQSQVKPYPEWVVAISVLLCALPVSAIPLVPLYHSFKKTSSRLNINTYRVSMENSVQEDQQ